MAGTTDTRALGPRQSLRWIWAQLTSMKTALVLLFLLALAAIPGSLVPQTAISPTRVTAFRAKHRLLDKIYEPIGMYHVYTSVWFSAIYLLLFVSLVGCIVPRILTYARQLRAEPVRVPKHPERLPEHVRADVPDAEAAADRAAGWLKEHRFRVARRVEDGVPTISAERGYLREFGNLLFHTASVFVLLGIAWTNLYGFKGSAIVVEGAGFSNVITQYDEFHAGALVDTDNLTPFTVDLEKFTVRFETGTVQRGAAREFDALVQVHADGTTSTEHLQVNHPLSIDGTKVHLLGHGYAARVTVTDGQGHVAFSGPVVMLPVDGNFRSNLVVKAPDARPKTLFFQGFFLPTAVIDPALGPRSLFPDAFNPELFLTGYTGTPAAETGRPQNIYDLDTTGLTQLTNGSQPLRIELAPGDSYNLPGGGKVSFDGWQRWTKLQISRTPGLWLTLASIVAAVAGLCLSLFVRPRRLFVRFVPASGDGWEMIVGGLDRAEGRSGLDDAVRDLAGAATGVPIGPGHPLTAESVGASTTTPEEDS